MRKFADNGLLVEHDPEKVSGEIVVINTCGFIGDAKEESVNMILEFARAKEKGEIKKLYVMGCLSERYMAELSKEIPEVDRYYGKFNWGGLINELVDNKYSIIPTGNKRYITTPKHYAYLKISEGCNRTCAFCAIPLITGKHKSFPIEKLLDEAKGLAESGVKELLVIAQDLSYYGLDIYKEHRLPELIERLSQIEGIEWIRLHYAYPAGFPFDVLKVIAQNPKVCGYLDIAFQHINDKVLKQMRRNVTKRQTIDLIRRIRNEVPGIHLRTTLIAGFPGETDEEFEELLDFVEMVKFERLGIFPYSEEEGTFSGLTMADSVPQDVKIQRANRVMELQESISLELNLQKVGTVLKVLIDRVEEDYFVGRTEFDSPEVDPEVMVYGKDLKVGEFYKVLITGAEAFDLTGKVV